MKLITFLGTGNYQPAIYVDSGKEFETCFFVQAVAEWHKPDEVLIMLTPTAKKQENWGKLQDILHQSDINFRGVDIPDGRSETELWEIFQALAGQFEQGEEVLFDVTHAFRSLPVLALLAANYLRVARGITMLDVVYGAYEAREEETNRAPVFSLMPFMNLLDWVTATDRFIKSGDANDLGQLLKEANKVPHMQDNIPKSELPTRLSGLSGTLGDLSNALRLTRPQEVAKYSAQLAERIQGVEEEANRYAPPFGVLLDQISNAYLPFSDDSLKTQLDLVNWYVERGQEVQAVTLANEWCISWTCQQLGLEVSERKTRESVTRAISSISRKRRGEKYDDHPLIECVSKLDNCEAKIILWDKLSGLRNDIAHCGMREEKGQTVKLIQQVVTYITELNTLYNQSSNQGEALCKQ